MTCNNSTAARQNPSMNHAATIHAQYVSEWDGGFQVASDARVDLMTGTVQADVSGDDVDALETLDRQFIQLESGAEFETEEINGVYVICDLPALHNAVRYTPATTQ